MSTPKEVTPSPSEIEDILDAWTTGVPDAEDEPISDMGDSFLFLGEIDDDHQSSTSFRRELGLEESPEGQKTTKTEETHEEEGKEDHDETPIRSRSANLPLIKLRRASPTPQQVSSRERYRRGRSARSSPRLNSSTSNPPVPLPDMPVEALALFEEGDGPKRQSSGSRKSPRGSSRLSRGRNPRNVRKQSAEVSTPVEIPPARSVSSSRFSLSRSPRRSPRQSLSIAVGGEKTDDIVIPSSRSPSRRSTRKSFASRRSKSMHSIFSGSQSSPSSDDGGGYSPRVSGLAAGGLFGMTLDDLMQKQREEGEETLKIPKIMKELIEGVFANGGMNQEGIFRLSVTTETKNEAINTVHDWGSVADIKDPHVHAVLLKEWLKRLGEPLLHYESCIKMAKNDNSGEETNVEIESLWKNSMSDNAKAVFMALTEAIQKMTNEEYVKKTKMDYKNLCIVFAPGLVRTNEEQSPLSMLKNQPLEQKAMEMLYLYVCENELQNP